MVLSLNALSAATLAAMQRHPRRVMGALGTLLLTTGVTAFGIAPLAPDAADLPVRQVLQAIDLPTLPPTGWDLSQPNAELAVQLTLYRHDTTRREDTAESLLQRLGVSDRQAQDFLRTNPLARGLLQGRAGKLVSVEMDDRQRLLKLTARWLDQRS
ncbi:MAG: M23 family peptidase, partial [Burkholderiaceae bacterium]|nr:M23 family peptidase [Burkholderiaceae bacterium]